MTRESLKIGSLGHMGDEIILGARDRIGLTACGNDRRQSAAIAFDRRQIEGEEFLIGEERILVVLERAMRVAKNASKVKVTHAWPSEFRRADRPAGGFAHQRGQEIRTWISHPVGIA